MPACHELLDLLNPIVHIGLGIGDQLVWTVFMIDDKQEVATVGGEACTTVVCLDTATNSFDGQTALDILRQCVAWVGIILDPLFM